MTTEFSYLNKRLDRLENRLNALDATVSYLYNETQNARSPADPEEDENYAYDSCDYEDDDPDDDEGGAPMTPWGGVLDAPIGARVVLWGTRPRKASAFAAFGPAPAEGFIDGVVLDRIGGQLVVACGVDRCAVFESGLACWLTEAGEYTSLGGLRLTCIEPEDTPRVPDSAYREGPSTVVVWDAKDVQEDGAFSTTERRFWAGGDRRVPAGTMVAIMLRGGFEAGWVSWQHHEVGSDSVAYRVRED